MDAYRIAYDGRRYHGFQRQPDVPTIEDELFAALRSLSVLGDEETPSGYAAAGRTDAGVSALAQTIGFDAPEWLSPSAFNSELPPSIRVWASTAVSEAFHATHHASQREYTYFLHGAGLDRERTRQALTALSGEHDFHNLTPDESGTVRKLSTTLTVDEPFFVLRLRAGGFARQLVRRIVSLVGAVGRGESELARIERLLGEKEISGPDGVGPAPAHPLVLTDVRYPFSFQVDPEAAASARKLFEKRRREAQTSARVTGTLVAGLDSHESA